MPLENNTPNNGSSPPSGSLPVVTIPPETPNTGNGDNGIKPDPETNTGGDTKSNINYDDFQRLTGELPELEAKPQVDKGKTEDTPTSQDQTPPDRTTPEPEGVKEGPPPENLGKTVHAKTGEGRDFTGIDPGHVPVFQRMSNEAFKTLKPIYLENKKLRTEVDTLTTKVAEVTTKGGALPDNYYAHPEAFILAPEFRQKQSLYDAYKYESSHWRQQLEAVEAGLPVRDLNIDDKGNFVTSDPIDITDDNRASLKAQILEMLSRANINSQQQHKELTEYASKYKYRHEQLTSFIRGLEKKFFPEYEDQNYKGWQQAKALIDALPPELKGNPLAGALGRMFGKLKEMQAQIVELKAHKPVTPTTTDPNSRNFNGTGSTKPRITYDMFQNL